MSSLSEAEAEKVVDFLKQKNLGAAATVVKSLIDAGRSPDKALTLKEEYDKLHQWASQSLELYRPELQAVLVSIFCHVISEHYTANRDVADAAALLDAYGADLPQDTVNALRVDDSDLRARLASGAPSENAMCEASYHLLLDYLSSEPLLKLLSLLNKSIRIKLVEGPPSAAPPSVPLGVEAASGVAVAWGALGGRAAGEGDPADAPRPDFADAYGAGLLRQVSFPAEPVFEVEPAEVQDALEPSCALATVLNAPGAARLACACIGESGRLVAGGFGDSSVRVFAAPGGGGAPDGDLGAKVLVGHSRCVHDVSLHPTERWLLSGGADGELRLWDLAPFSDSNSNARGAGAPRCAVRFVESGGAPTHACAFGRSGQHFLSGGRDTCARLWQCDRTFPVRVFAGHSSDVADVQWHPNAHFALTAAFDRSARLWDARAGGPAARVLLGGAAPLLCAAVSPCGRFAAAGAADGEVRVWDLSNGRERAVLRGHRGAVHAAAFSADGAAIATSGADCSVRIWDWEAATLDAGDAKDAAGRQKQVLAPHRTLHTKATPVVGMAWTKRNLLLGVGAFCAERLLP